MGPKIAGAPLATVTCSAIIASTSTPGVLCGVAAREHDLRRCQYGSLGEAPALAVEHWGDQQDRVVAAHAQRGDLGHGVQVDAAVGVVDALGAAGGPGGVAGAVGGG